MKPREIIVDSDVLLQFFEGSEEVAERLSELLRQHTLFLTPVSVTEIVAGLRPDEERKVDNLFEVMQVLAINKEIGKMAGAYMREHHRKKGVGFNTALIAAAVEHFGFSLWTMERRNYPMLAQKSFIK